MKPHQRLLLPSLIVALVALLPHLAHTASVAAVTTAIEHRHVTALNKFRADYRKSVQQGDPGMLAPYFAEDIRLMTESIKTVLGRTNALSYHQAFSVRFTVKACTRDELEILDLGSRVIEAGLFTVKLVSRSTGKEHTLSGKYLDIWAKSADGGLSLATSAWNYDQQLEIADELRFVEVPAVQMAFQAHVPVRDSLSFELAALNKLLETAVSEHNATVWSLFFADDALLLPNHEPLCRGRKAVDDYIADHVKYLPVFEKLDIRNDRIDDLGGYVIEYATHVANWRNGDSSGVNTGKNIRIWRRAPNGALKLFRQIGAYD